MSKRRAPLQLLIVTGTALLLGACGGGDGPSGGGQVYPGEMVF